MSTIPVRRKRFLGLPPWVLPTLIAVVLLTGWMLLAGDDEPETDVIEAGPVVTDVPDPNAVSPELPASPPPGAPLPSASGAPVGASSGTSVDQATEAAIAAGSAAGAAAGARAGQAVLASVADVGRTIRASGSAAGALNGRAVQMRGVRVSEVLSDRAFIVGSGSDRVMVVMDPSGGDVPVRVGEQIAVTGSLETYAPGPSESGAARDAGQSGYVVATRPGGIAR
ncbi:MAG TPA: hypothetical protein VGB53_01110 [Rubricoccaceae bacterium]|jgi:hypothetical protein